MHTSRAQLDLPGARAHIKTLYTRVGEHQHCTYLQPLDDSGTHHPRRHHKVRQVQKPVLGGGDAIVRHLPRQIGLVRQRVQRDVGACRYSRYSFTTLLYVRVVADHRVTKQPGAYADEHARTTTLTRSQW